MIIHTRAGQAVITHPELTILADPRWAMKGRIALGKLVHPSTSTWCLFWEWGADWDVFTDDCEELAGWEPEAVEAAINEAIKQCPECAEDMEWFVNWVNNAKDFLSTDAI